MLRLGSKVRLAKNGFSLRPAQVAFRFSTSSVAGATDVNPHIKESPFKDFGYDNFPGYGLPNPACNVFDHYEWWSCLQQFPVYKYAPVMSQAMYDEREKAPVARAYAYDLVHGIEMAFQKVKDHLMFRTSQPILSFEQLIQVGTVATNGDRHVGELVARAVDKVGPDGAFFISEKIKSNNELMFDSGMSFDFGLVSPIFITNVEEESCVLRNPFILIHENKISRSEIFRAAMELNLKSSNRPLLVVTEDIDEEEVASIILDWNFVGLEIYIAKPHAYVKEKKAVMKDLAVLTGGKAQMVRATYDLLDVLGGSGRQAEIEERCRQLKTEIAASTSLGEIKLLKERLSRFHGGAAVFQVGGGSKKDVHKKNKRVFNALKAAKSAAHCGILPGGGVALLHASKELDAYQLSHCRPDVQLGVQLFQHALKMPVYSIASNVGLDGSAIVKRLMEQEDPCIGYDPTRGEYVDMIEAGNIDPLYFVIRELQGLVNLFKLHHLCCKPSPNLCATPSP